MTESKTDHVEAELRYYINQCELIRMFFNEIQRNKWITTPRINTKLNVLAEGVKYMENNLNILIVDRRITLNKESSNG